MPAPESTSGESTDPPSSSPEPPSSRPNAPGTHPRAASDTRTGVPRRVAVGAVRHRVGLPQHARVPATSIAFAAAGKFAPLVTVLVACVTLLLAALPVYCYIAGRSPHGGGSTALLERVIPGWFGKLLLLVLLAFGAVDLVFTPHDFSAATAAGSGAPHLQPAATRVAADARRGDPRGGEGVRQELSRLGEGAQRGAVAADRPWSRSS